MKQFLYVFIGGGFGSVLRYAISVYAKNQWPKLHFPWHTFAINIVGCFLIGIFGGLLAKNEPSRWLLIAGFCGGFTTFSTFAAENSDMISTGNYTQVILYTLLSVVIGILAVAVGLGLTK